MNNYKNKDVKIELGDKKYNVRYTPNVIEKVQERFGVPICQLGELAKDERETLKVLKGLLTILINEAIDDSENGEPHITENFVGRNLTASNIFSLRDALCAPAEQRRTFFRKSKQ